MRVGDTVRTAIPLPGIPAGAAGTVKETGRLFVLVAFEDGRTRYYAPRQLISIPQRADTDARRWSEEAPLGIAGLRLPRGSHSCLLPSTESATLNATASFTAAGLRDGETVLCGVPSKWQSAFLARLRQLGLACDQHLSRATLLVMSPSRIYLPRAQFTAQKQLDRTAAIMARASKGNVGGARAFAHGGRRHTVPGWWEYEERIAPLIKGTGTTTLCVYDSSGWGTESWRKATEVHSYVVRDGLVTRGGTPVV